jgi:hypothetical protein
LKVDKTENAWWIHNLGILVAVNIQYVSLKILSNFFTHTVELGFLLYVDI